MNPKNPEYYYIKLTNRLDDDNDARIKKLERENAALHEEVVKANGLLDMQMKELAKLREDSKIVDELCALHGCGKEFLMIWCRAAAYAQKEYTRKEAQS